jgi:hypothetical protein
MRTFPALAAVVTAAVVIAIVIDSENWFRDHFVLVVIGCLAVALVGFNWWEVWSTRHQR